MLQLFDIVWNASNSCYTIWQLIFSLIIGGLFGVAWGAIIASTKTPALQYFSGINNNEVCSVPSKQTFKCKVYQNGKLLAGMQPS